MRIAVVAVLLAAAQVLYVQTATSDINLARLAEAVNAITEDRLPRAEELLNSVLAA